MKEIRFHGRGGQGAVTAAEVLAVAAHKDGKFSQAFPFFGVERRGAPVMAFARIDDKFIRTRQQIYEPDIVVVLDSTLAQSPEVTQGLRPGGIVILNTTTKPNLQSAAKVTMVDATKIALEEIGKPFVNMPMLGALVKATNIVSLESVLKTIEERYPGEVGKKNAKAIKRTYEETR